VGPATVELSPVPVALVPELVPVAPVEVPEEVPVAWPEVVEPPVGVTTPDGCDEQAAYARTATMNRRAA
jgi:hypothetical protein